MFTKPLRETNQCLLSKSWKTEVDYSLVEIVVFTAWHSPFEVLGLQLVKNGTVQVFMKTDLAVGCSAVRSLCQHMTAPVI